MRPDPSDPPECLACGTCCFSELPEYVRVFGVDHDRMGDRAAEFTHFLGNKCYMRLEDGHCAALRIDPVARRFACTIYEVRPDACRSLERGSPACRAEIHEKGARPPLAVEALLRRARSS
jgi:hypothetical protein